MLTPQICLLFDGWVPACQFRHVVNMCILSPLSQHKHINSKILLFLAKHNYWAYAWFKLLRR
jgi:hypothetical protein